MLQPVNFVRLAVLDILSYLLSRAIQYHAPKLPPLHPLEAINSLKPADWETGFKAKLTAKSLMPYKEYTGIIEQSGNDKRQHRLIRLPNNLVALCVQDTDAKEAAASLSVNVGSSADPIELQGLAHFLEHMLFLGTEKYPKEGEYNAFLANHSGRSNAYTSFTETNYYFSVFNGALENALDRFAQFFISPLLNADCVDRELNAVDSEHKGYLQSDSWRTYQLVAMTSNPAHPYSGFNVGNIETLKGAAEKLGLDLREELIKFYQKYYSADIMRLTVVGNHSLDVLTEWVVSKFSEIASKGNTKPTFVGHPIGKAQLGKLVHYKTVIESYLLRLQFSLPELKSIYKENQYTYIDALLNHKGPGSIFSVLRKNSWATEINCGSSGVYYDGFGIYEIDIDATPEGLDNYEAIVSIIFEYLKMLAESGPQEWLYKELSLINKVNFDFKNKEEAEDYASSLSYSGQNQYVTPQHTLSHSSLLREYDADLISKCLRYLNPNNYRLFIGAQEHKAVECKLEEKYYGVLHNIAELPSHLTSNVKCSRSVSKQLHLPDHNAFLPDNLSVSKPDVLANPPAVEPVLLRKNDKIEVWFKKDDQFFTPHGHIGLIIGSESIDNTTLNHLLTRILCSLVSAELQEQLYSASIANSKFGIVSGAGSINIGVSGFSSRLPHLLKTLLQKLRTFAVDAQQFSTYLAKEEQMIRSRRQENPLQYLYEWLGATSVAPAFDQVMLEEALKDVTLDGLQAHAESVLGKAYVKMIMSGNYTQSVALDTSSQVLDILQHKPAPRYLVNTYRSLAVEPGYYLQNVPIGDQKCLNSAAISTFYCGSVSDTRDAVTLQLLKNLVNNAFFTQLRTSEQLGYRAGASFGFTKNGKGILEFFLEGESNPAYVTQRINQFIREYRLRLIELSTEEFESSVQSLISLKQEKLLSMDDEFSRLWVHISSDEYMFDTLDKEVEQLKQLSKDNLLEFWDKYINKDTAKHYTRLDMQMWSTKIWQPTPEEFEMYPSAVLSLFGCLCSGGHTALSITEVHSFILSVTTSNSIDTVLEELGELYMSKQAPSTTNADSARTAFGTSSKIATALQMAISSAQDMPNFANQSKTNFASIGMKQSPEGIWLINDYTQFKSSQALHGLPVPVRSFVPLIPEPVPVEVSE